ncbi:hypothetical protein H6G91_33130 [Nostoc muscorum FACHB-395]|nr:hypothetical protein [Desmonostoc muscorum FACHB-395]
MFLTQHSARKQRRPPTVRKIAIAILCPDRALTINENFTNEPFTRTVGDSSRRATQRPVQGASFHAAIAGLHGFSRILHNQFKSGLLP